MEAAAASAGEAVKQRTMRKQSGRMRRDRKKSDEAHTYAVETRPVQETLLHAELPEPSVETSFMADEETGGQSGWTGPDVCMICDGLKPHGIRLLERFICDDCEAEMVKTDVSDDKYDFFIRQMHKLWMPKDA